MSTLTLRGNQIGEALQFDGNGGTTTVEIGRVWFTASDTVTMTFAPGAFDPVTGAMTGGAGTITSLSVTSADGRVTIFTVPTNPLDIDPDQSKLGPNFFYISESPAPGSGGAFAGLQLEKIVVSVTPLVAGTLVPFQNGGGFTDAPIVTPPQPPQLIGTAGNDVLVGNADANMMSGLDGNDRISGLDGADTIEGGNGNDVLNGGNGNDQIGGGAGNDRIIGGNGADRGWGGTGNDLFDGGAGRDVFTGGFGGDSFVFGAGDRVTDFNAGQGDQILFAQSLGLDLADIRVTRDAAGTTIAFGTQTMRLDGVTQPFDLGNHIKFDYVPSTDFL